MPPRRREDDWHYGFIWGACGGAMLIALAASPVFSWGDGFGRVRPALADTHAAPQPALSAPRSQLPRASEAPALDPAPSESLPAQPNHDTGVQPVVASSLLLPTPDTSIMPASALAGPASLASEPRRQAEPVPDLTLRGKLTRLHGGWLNRKALCAAIAKVRTEGHACARAASSKQQTPLTLRFVLRSSGGVDSVHAVKPRDAHRPLFICAKETLEGLSLPHPRGGVAHLEAVVRLGGRSKR